MTGLAATTAAAAALTRLPTHGAEVAHTDASGPVTVSVTMMTDTAAEGSGDAVGVAAGVADGGAAEGDTGAEKRHTAAAPDAAQ